MATPCEGVRSFQHWLAPAHRSARKSFNTLAVSLFTAGLRNLLGRPFGDHPAPTVTTLGTEIDQPVRLGGSLHADYLAYRKHLERFYGRRGISWKRVVDTPGKWLYMLERAGETVEMATRVAYYEHAVRRGEHPRHAAYLAREIGSDYAMRGDHQGTNFVYDSAMFLKAGMNGLDRIYRGFTSDPNRAAVAMKTGMLAAASAGLYLYNRGIPEYEELEDWDRDLQPSAWCD